MKIKAALILHGIQGTSQENWLPWLKGELEKRKWNVICPDLPDTMHPDRSKWLQTLRNLTNEIDFAELTIFAHSLSAATALDLIESENKKIDMFVSVSGFPEAHGAELNDYFMKGKVIDIEKVKSLIGKVVVIYGDDDPYVPQNALKKMADQLGVEPVIIPKGGHMNSKAGFTTFPLLLGILSSNGK